MDKHNRGSLITFTKITARMWLNNNLSHVHTAIIKNKEISQKKADVWPQRTYVQLLISAQGVNRQ